VSVEAADGRPPVRDDGADLAALVLTHPDGGEVTRLGRNEAGTFFRVFQANKWRKKKAEAAAAAAAAAATLVAAQ